MPDIATSNSTGRKLIRCAIYTRKSHEEGLEQEFNSLDAQREAAEAYIESQRMQGWRALPDPYGDGGFSGSPTWSAPDCSVCSRCCTIPVGSRTDPSPV